MVQVPETLGNSPRQPKNMGLGELHSRARDSGEGKHHHHGWKSKLEGRK